MGIEYKLIFIDEYDWGYANKKKDDYKNIVADCGFNVVAGADSMIIVDCHKTPEDSAIELLSSKGFVFDHAYYQTDRGDLKQWKLSKRLPE